MTQKPVDLEALSALEAKGAPSLEDLKTPITPSPLMAKAGHLSTVRARFWSKVEKSASCWNWTGCLDGTKRYGALHKAKAHRVSWELHFGPIPSGQHVLHRCDNGFCVRPEHLFLGTNLDNIIDKTAKGRAAGKKKKRTHCKRGHLFTEENSRYTSGGRRCLRCEAERKIAIRDWRKERAALLAEVASLKSENNAAPAMIEELRSLRAHKAWSKSVEGDIQRELYGALGWGFDSNSVGLKLIHHAAHEVVEERHGLQQALLDRENAQIEDRKNMRADTQAALDEVVVWKKEHGKVHGDWIETRKKCSALEAERDALRAELLSVRDRLDEFNQTDKRESECVGTLLQALLALRAEVEGLKAQLATAAHVENDALRVELGKLHDACAVLADLSVALAAQLATAREALRLFEEGRSLFIDGLDDRAQDRFEQAADVLKKNKGDKT